MLNPWVRSGKCFFTIEIGHEIFSRAIFSLPLIFSYWLKQKIKTISYSSSSLLKKLASLYEPHHEKKNLFYHVKTKVLISYAAIPQLLITFVFAYKMILSTT